MGRRAGRAAMTLPSVVRDEVVGPDEISPPGEVPRQVYGLVTRAWSRVGERRIEREAPCPQRGHSKSCCLVDPQAGRRRKRLQPASDRTTREPPRMRDIAQLLPAPGSRTTSCGEIDRRRGGSQARQVGAGRRLLLVVWSSPLSAHLVSQLIELMVPVPGRHSSRPRPHYGGDGE